MSDLKNKYPPEMKGHGVKQDDKPLPWGNGQESASSGRLTESSAEKKAVKE